MSFLKSVVTPHKHGSLVLKASYKEGEFDSHGVDCPFVFWHEGRYWMTFVGFDGVGYQTGIAYSVDLTSWTKQGLLIGRGPRGSVTQYNIALTSLLRENDLHGRGLLKRVGGRFVGTYHAYPDAGYENGPAVIGLCFSEDLRQWELGDPVLYPDPDCAWESGGLYKSWILEFEGTYYLFYNAKNSTSAPWVEQTGVALSKDLKHWQRHAENPILPLGSAGAFDDVFASDPCVLRVDDQWVMFYFGLSSDGHAREGVAFSSDLIQWRKADDILVDVGPDGSIDSLYAHKPALIARDGRVYHFYCAVSPAKTRIIGKQECREERGITFAYS
ncbi:MAG: hypothetical protein JJU20_10655 [Opitutales bacterium]|nr:hypothetical protein [Opitutales bacterium]